MTLYVPGLNVIAYLNWKNLRGHILWNEVYRIVRLLQLGYNIILRVNPISKYTNYIN